MMTLHPDRLTREEQRMVADSITSTCHVALRPIRFVGRMVFWWSLGRKDRPRLHAWPRVTWS